MINLQFLTDKPVISVFEAAFQGKTAGFLTKNRLKTVEYFVVQSTFLEISSLRFIPFKKILAVGDNAVTLQNNLCINNREEIDLTAYIHLNMGVPVYNDNGAFFGNLADAVVNEGGQVFMLQTENTEFKPEKIKSVSHDMIVLAEKAPRKKLPKNMPAASENSVVELLSTEESEIFKEILVTESLPQSIEKSGIPVPYESSPPTPAKLISDCRFLLGRLVTESIYSQRRELIIPAGTVITAAVVERAKLFGRLVELTVSSKS